MSQFGLIFPTTTATKPFIPRPISVTFLGFWFRNDSSAMATCRSGFEGADSCQLILASQRSMKPPVSQTQVSRSRMLQAAVAELTLPASFCCSPQLCRGHPNSWFAPKPARCEARALSAFVDVRQRFLGRPQYGGLQTMATSSSGMTASGSGSEALGEAWRPSGKITRSACFRTSSMMMK